MNVSSVSDWKHLSKSTSASKYFCSLPIEKNELPNSGFLRIEMSPTRGSGTARDQNAQKPRAPPTPPRPPPPRPPLTKTVAFQTPDPRPDHQVGLDALLVQALEAAGLV